MSSLGVVLDTNLLLSGLAYPRSVPGKLIAAWCHGALYVVLSPFILEEVRRTLPKLTQRHGLTAPEIDDPDGRLRDPCRGDQPRPRERSGPP